MLSNHIIFFNLKFKKFKINDNKLKFLNNYIFKIIMKIKYIDVLVSMLMSIAFT